VDYPGFNLRFAKKVHKLGLKVIYYICPQVWAWNKARIPQMAESIDRLITIFPFEATHFENTGLAVDFVGHPLVDEARKALAEPDQELPWQGEPHIALLPGSRKTEVEKLLPVMLGAASVVEQQHATASFIVAAPSETIAGIARNLADSLTCKPNNLAVVTGKTRHILRQARAAIVASGTATVEAALLGCPMVIAYRMAPLSYLFCRMLVKVDHIGMVNIIAGQRVCPEFVQSKATPDLLARALVPLLEDSLERSEMLRDLDKVGASLGTGGVEERTADIIVSELQVRDLAPVP
jgi:lipid-A-disaccharide synthase